MTLRPTALPTLALLMTTLFAGCATPLPASVDGNPGLAVPAVWTGAAGSATPTPLAGWWRRFDDPLLSRLIDDALLG